MHLKDIQEQNFSLDTLYRDFLFYETICVNEYFVKGKISLYSGTDNSTEVNLYTNDPKFNFFSVRSNFPLEVDAEISDNVLYSVVSGAECDTTDFNNIFNPGYTVVGFKPCTYHVPMFKTLYYSHFPHVVIGKW